MKLTKIAFQYEKVDSYLGNHMMIYNANEFAKNLGFEAVVDEFDFGKLYKTCLKYGILIILYL